MQKEPQANHAPKQMAAALCSRSNRGASWPPSLSLSC